jgi:2-polyprenyl-3-methyl-5-hydroxy-6-metoxy-1,4-benzoquinol methylase
MQYNPTTYWYDRLKQNFNLAGVGYLTLGQIYNKWQYRLRGKTVENLLINIPRNIKILDIGSGTGFYLSLFKKLGFTNVTGLDITSISVENLKSSFPDYKIFEIDFSAIHLDGLDTEGYDLITIFDVMFHVTEDSLFFNAIKNLSKFLKKDGIALISDYFPTQDKKIREHVFIRSEQNYLDKIKKSGLILKNKIPLFYLMNEPSGTDNKLLWLVWKINSKILSILPILGYLFGPIFFAVDSILNKIFKNNPSTKIWVLSNNG